MSYLIVKCTHCKQIFSSEDFDAHKRDLPLTECKKIEVVYFQDDSFKNKKLMTGWGTDGFFIPLRLYPENQFR